MKEHKTDGTPCWCNPKIIKVIYKNMTKKDMIELLKKEIKWCNENPKNMPEEWREGFISGLKQAIKMVRLAPL